MSLYLVDNLPRRINLGSQTERGVSEIRIDCSAWMHQWPGLNISVWVTPPRGSGAYPATTHMDGETVVWLVNASDTAIAGRGSVEIMGISENQKKLSAIVETQIARTSTAVTTTPPEQAQPWVDQVLDAARRAEDAAERAENAGGGGGSGGGSGGIAEETDPTVPAWAKQPTKPSYTAEEVNARPADWKPTPQEIGAASAEDVVKLSEEIAELKGEGKTEPVTYTPDIEGFLGTSGNFITNTEGTARTDYIALDGYVRVVAQSYLSSNAYSLAFFDGGKQIIKDASVAGLGALTQNRIDMIIPAGAAYCMLSHYPQGGNPGFVTLYPADSADAEDSLFGKTIDVLGDSITSTGYTRPTWWEMIAEKAGCYINNYGVSGTSIAVRDGRTDSFVERAAIMQTDADAVIVMGGTNDNQTVRGAWGSADNTTFFGALNILIGTLCNNFAGKPVIICTPIQTAGGYASNVHNTAETLMSKVDTDTLTMQERAAAIKLKCEQYGMHCLDLYNGSGINGRDTDHVYYRDGDSLHPSEAGQKRLANLMRRELERFFGIE